jgi:ATP-dependent Lhr-like helicase
MSLEYDRLDFRVQKWVYKQGWSDLREIQKKAIEPILAGDRDVLISASTATGKTEAFFLPACSAIADSEEGFGILYISPLKALINDQYRRLEGLCDMLDMRVTPWHGDSLQSKKKQAKKNPSGILLITPESLESLLVRESGWVSESFSSLKYIVIDEFHAFIGSERGQHLLSLLNRLEHLLGRYKNPIPRVALSATLGELDTVPLSLRPNKSMLCETITSSKASATVKVQVQGFTNPIDMQKNDKRVPADLRICQVIYDLSRGGSHLVFANSRQRTESIAAQLSDFCEQNVVPNEFFPHHGSLAKELRQDLESRLQKDSLPTTAICTMTLELGIDIGKVNSVFQVTPPHSVSSLRQRMGRSGRRNSPSILRMLITEDEVNADSNITDKLRMRLVQAIAMIRLLISSKWFEPADSTQMYFSTLLHQVLAVTAQWGGIRADQLYKLLCVEGPFQKTTQAHFISLLSHMGKNELLTQLSSGELSLGIQGEKLVNQYTFYAVFKTPQEFRIITEAKTLGTLPIDSLIIVGQHLIFGGKRWKVEDVDLEKKVIRVKATKGGRPPSFGGGGMSIHDRIRQEMYDIYCEGDYRIKAGNSKINFIDQEANSLFSEGSQFFNNCNLVTNSILKHNGSVYIFPWKGDKIVNALTVILTRAGYVVGASAGVIEVEETTIKSVTKTLTDSITKDFPTETELSEFVKEKKIEKYDDFLPDDLLTEGYGQRAFDSTGAKSWVESFINTN